MTSLFTFGTPPTTGQSLLPDCLGTKTRSTTSSSHPTEQPLQVRAGTTRQSFGMPETESFSSLYAAMSRRYVKILGPGRYTACYLPHDCRFTNAHGVLIAAFSSRGARTARSRCGMPGRATWPWICQGMRTRFVAPRLMMNTPYFEY